MWPLKWTPIISGLVMLVVIPSCSSKPIGSADQPDAGTDTHFADADNLGPTAVVSDQTVLVDTTISVSGESSTDPEGDPLTYAWNLRSAPPLSTATLNDPTSSVVTFAADSLGVFVIELVVNDGEHDSAPAAAEILVVSSLDPPVADAGPDQTVFVGSQVQVSGAGSHDPNDHPLSYSWTITSQPPGGSAMLSTAVAPSVSFSADTIGVFDLELVVSNGSLPSAPDTVTITAIPVAGDLSNGLLNPGEVYLLGTVAPGSCGRDAIVHWSDPTVGAAGFDCDAVARSAMIRTDGVLLITNTLEDLLREFHCDGCPSWSPGQTYPTNVLANDTVLPTPPCNGATQLQFRAGVGGVIIHGCTGSWYDSNGMTLPLVDTPLSLGYDDKVLTSTEVIDIGTGARVAVAGLPGGTIVTTRVAGPDAFWLALLGVHTELWRIAHDGSATLDGTYPDPPAGNTVFEWGRLDQAGNLFQFGTADVIVRRTVTGISEVVYTESTNPPVEIHISALVTGP